MWKIQRTAYLYLFKFQIIGVQNWILFLQKVTRQKRTEVWIVWKSPTALWTVRALGMRSCFNIQQEVDVKLCNPRLKTVKKFYFFFKIIIAMKMLIERDI